MNKILGATLIVLAVVSLTFFFSDFFYGHYSGFGYRTLDPDSLFFLRIFEKIMIQGSVPAYDNYGSFPDTLNFQYPPFYMFILQKAANFLRLVWPEQSLRYLVGWLPPFFGWVLAIILVSFVWQKSRNGVLTLLVSFACVPGLISKSIYKFLKIDYHFLNNFFIWIWIISAALYCDSRKRWHLILGVVVSFLLQMTWSGTPLFFFIVILYFLFLLFFKARILSAFAFYSSFSMVISSLPVLFFQLISGVKTFSLWEWSLLQPILILCGGIFVGITLWMLSFSWQTRIVLLIPMFIFVAMFFPYFFEDMKVLFTYIAKFDLNLQSINEFKTGIDLSKILISLSGVIPAILKLRLVFFMLPFLVFFNPSGLFNGGGNLLRGFSAIFLLMGCFSERYFRWLGIVIGLWNGIALFVIFCIINSAIRADNSELFKKNFKYLFFLPFLLLHFLWSYPMFYKSDSNKRLISAMNWIRDNTPPTSGFMDNNPPEYGIYNYWRLGNVINYYAQRPTIANNFLAGYGKMAEIFCATNEETAYAICEKYKIRYFFIESFYDFSDQLVRFMRAYYLRSGVTGPKYRFFPDYIDNPEDSFRFDQTFHYWLRNKLAIEPSGMFSEAASRLRIVYCNEYHSPSVLPTYLLFELVRGAVVKGNADAGSEVEVFLNCRFAEVETKYKRKVKVSEQGNFSIRLPYANSWKNGNVETGNTYQIYVFINGKKIERTFSLSENDVSAGNEINLY